MSKRKQKQQIVVETNFLPRKKLFIVFPTLAFALFISFIDQNSIGVALPTIGEDLDAATTIAWAGTSSLIANTLFQVLYGRLSDIFGRKVVFLMAVGLLALGDLLCSFAKTGPQLYVYRGIAGIGNGGITALSIMIVSDIVTLEERGKYQGIIGSMIGAGNTVGPFLAAAFVTKSTWRALFWMITPLAVLAGVIVTLVLPQSKVNGTMKEKLRAIDYAGVGTSAAAVLLLLIPISGGGTYFEWNSPMVISMLVLGSVCAIAFVLIEWKFAFMPMMPLHLFKIPAVLAVFIQNFLLGIVYYSHLYFLPIYYQNVRLFSPLKAAALTIPLVVAQSCFSVTSGQYISRTKRYGEVIWAGFTLWTLGAGLVLLFNRTTSTAVMAVALIIEGAGVGFIFQPTIIAAQAHSAVNDRAVVISVRNFLRSLGAAAGLALSSAIFSNVLRQNLENSASVVPETLRNRIMGSVLKVPDLTAMTGEEGEAVLNAYAKASKGVFYLWAPLMGVCLLLCILIKDRGLQRPADKEKAEEGETSSASVTDDADEVFEGEKHSDNKAAAKESGMVRKLDVAEKTEAGQVGDDKKER